jgi:hypothetical protein
MERGVLSQLPPNVITPPVGDLAPIVLLELRIGRETVIPGEMAPEAVRSPLPIGEMQASFLVRLFSRSCVVDVLEHRSYLRRPGARREPPAQRIAAPASPATTSPSVCSSPVDRCYAVLIGSVVLLGLGVDGQVMRPLAVT